MQQWLAKCGKDEGAMHVLSVLRNKPDLSGGGGVARFGVVGQQGGDAVAVMRHLAQPGMS